MKPASLSATALTVALQCPARYEAEYVNKTQTSSNAAADLGSAVHEALERYVKQVYIDKIIEPSVIMLLHTFGITYQEIFGHAADKNSQEYIDGYAMLQEWYKRTIDYFPQVQVETVETKQSFDIPTSIGPLKFNYIFDRLDKVSDDEIKVVDYKTIRVPIRAEDLGTKIQARCYGLAAQIMYPKAQEIWVEFDLLRHDPIARRFTKDDNAETWRWLKLEAQKIVDVIVPDERINIDCRYCVRKAGCGTLKLDITSGGIGSIQNVDEAVDLLAKVTYRKNALDSLGADLEGLILSYAEDENVLQWETDDTQVSISASRRRAVDFERASKLLDPELVKKYGTMGVTALDRLLKSENLPPQTVHALKTLIYYKTGEPKVTVKPK